MTAVGMAVLIGAAGCTRTSDGSYVMRKPVALTRFLGLGRSNASPAQTAQIAQTAQVAQIAQVNEPRYFPPPSAAAPPPARRVNSSAPSLSIVKNPPFKRPQSGKPISCRNETSPSGRIRVVCG
jgi:hypothetical protein